MMNKSGVPIDDKLREASKNELQEIDRILSQPKFAVISNDIEKHRGGNGSIRPGIFLWVSAACLPWLEQSTKLPSTSSCILGHPK